MNLGAMELREDGMEAKLDIRFPISMNTAEIFSKVKDVFAPLGIEAEILHAMEPHYVDENTPFIQSLKRVYEDQLDVYKRQGLYSKLKQVAALATLCDGTAPFKNCSG